MWHYLYETATGRLASESSLPIDPPAGYAVASFEQRQSGAWNPETHEFDPLPPVRALSRLEFLRRFTAAERIAIRASTDPVVEDMMALQDAAEYIDIDDADTQAGLQYLASVGLLTPGRAAEIAS